MKSANAESRIASWVAMWLPLTPYPSRLASHQPHQIPSPIVVDPLSHQVMFLRPLTALR